MTREELETQIAAAREALLAAGNPGTYLVAEEIEPLRDALAAAPEGDRLLSLLPEFVELAGSPYYTVRRVSAYVVYGQVEGSLAEEADAERAQRFADDFARWRGAMLPNELVGLYNHILDEARATGTDDPLVVGDVRAATQPSGYAALSGVYAQAALEASAAALRPPDADEPSEAEDEPEDGQATEEPRDGADPDPAAGP